MSSRKKTNPSARFTEASLIQELEKKGLGRLSTYAAILDNIIKRGYAHILQGGCFIERRAGYLTLRT